MTNSSISILVVVLLFSMPLSISAQETDSEIQQAREDAENDAEKYVSLLSWGAAGFACSCFGFAYAYASTPQIPAASLIGKSPTYVAIYTDVYRQHAKRRRMQASVIGWGLSSAFGTVYYLLAL